MSYHRIASAFVIAAAALALAACAALPEGEPVADEEAGDTAEARLAFWHGLDESEAISNDQVLHGLLLFVTGKDPSRDYPGRLAAARRRGLVPPGFDASGSQSATRGTVAYALAQGLELDAGVTVSLFGPSPRYALRALTARDIFPPSSAQQTISGGAFLAVVSRAEDYQRLNGGGMAMAARPGDVRWADLVVDRVLMAQADGEAAPAHAAADADGDGDPVEVTSVRGMVQVRAAVDQAWQAAKEGMQLPVGAELRTGPRSAVRLFIEPDQIITLDRLGVMTVLEALRRQNTARVDLGLTYGRTQYEVEAAGVEHESSIRAPGAFLGIRGTQSARLAVNREFAPESVIVETRADLRLAQRAHRHGMSTAAVPVRGRGEVTARGDEPSVSSTSRTDSATNPQGEHAALTDEEFEALAQNPDGASQLRDQGLDREDQRGEQIIQDEDIHIENSQDLF